MTQEEKDLLLKDLCARLPYGVICYDEVQQERGIFKQFEYEGFGRIHNGRGLRFIENIKPYLRPMSSITKEECKELEDLPATIENISDWIPNIPYYMEVVWPDQIDWFNKHHIDYRCLIEKGLAIEVTEENNPYAKDID